MEPHFMTIMVVLATVIATIFLAPVILFRPLVLAISKRIAGRQGESEEIKLLKSRIVMVEQQLNAMHSRVDVLEESNQFAHKVLEDVVKKSGKESD
jgi:hypothetical protein